MVKVEACDDLLIQFLCQALKNGLVSSFQKHARWKLKYLLGGMASSGRVYSINS